jgi:hypothetical protein
VEHGVGPEGSFAIPADETHAVGNREDGVVRGVECFSPSRPHPDRME